MKRIKAYIGDQTPEWKKDLATNFFQRVGYLVDFEIKTYLIRGIEISSPNPDEHFFNLNNLFNYVHGLEETSQSRLHYIRQKKTI